MLEPPTGSCLRQAPPLLKDGSGESALFAYLAVGKQSAVCHFGSEKGAAVLHRRLAAADILIDDTPLAERAEHGLESGAVAKDHSSLIHVSVLPFGASGCKSGWGGEEVNLVHASGEGFLLPNGYAHELFPERAPLKMYGHFAGYQGGLVAAISALAALWSSGEVGGQYIDVSTQDAMLLCGAFALQRLGDGSLEHRAMRKFRYGGVFETQDGYIELFTLEDRQWQGLVKLLGEPEWAQDEALQDPLERSRRGDEINHHVREWMAARRVEDVVTAAQELGVPAAKYRTPSDVLNGEHERHRSLFEATTLADGRAAEILLAPFQFNSDPLHFQSGVPALGSADNTAQMLEAQV
jgi:benzylsuccinate CoA-transferase BbsE subunit